MGKARKVAMICTRCVKLDSLCNGYKATDSCSKFVSIKTGVKDYERKM